ncbi:MAG TPA: hypothetical protein VF526_15410 [Solirubrobacteraceae bacterium]|jgi:hypothetical protein
MADGAVNLGGVVGGRQFDGTVARTGTGRASEEASLAAGHAGTLSTRTDANTGVVTVASHAITTQDKVGLFWSGGSRRGMTVTAVTGTTVSIDVGSGTDLPAASTAAVVCAETTLDIDFAGDTTYQAVAQASGRATFSFQQGGGTEVIAVELNSSGQANEFWEWHTCATGGTTNPFAGVTVGQVVVSNGDSSSAVTVRVGVVKA